MNYTTPEKVGISSAKIEEYIKVLEDSNLCTHSIIIMRRGNIVFEKYWAPFHKDFLHRMYSVTKSFVGIAMGFLEQDGLVDLDAPISKYFPEEIKNQPDENMRNQTLRHMLMMSTAKPCMHWFNDKPADRVKYYFENSHPFTRPSGTGFDYDSTGSFILGALVERITGKTLLDYLREKVLDRIGFSKEAYILKCPGGHSWSDSALVCKPTDLLKTAMFCMNKGKWDGEQILNEAYMTAATTKQIDNNPRGLNELNCQGYGYQFWMCYEGAFLFNGMGAQLGLCIPDKDIILIYNADLQGHVEGKKVVIDNFYRLIVHTAKDAPIEENESEIRSLEAYANGLKLFAAKGDKTSAFADKVNGVTYTLDKNPMGITKIKFCFEGDKGTMYYTNAQGDKELPFGMCENAFAKFPQEGYSDEVGTQKGNRLYDCATSAAWVSPCQLFMKVQIIDNYFGILTINVGFREDRKIGISMIKSAEDFLGEYSGWASGKAEK